MQWKSYEKKVLSACKLAGKTDAYISSYLDYARPLFDIDAPIIFTASQFSALVGLDHNYVCRMAFAPKHFYRTYRIKKKNGKLRRIDEPLPDLKRVQQWVLHEILEKVTLNAASKAFRSGYSIKDNARFHRKQQIVLSLDIKDFFPSIRKDDVYRIFRDIGYNKKVAYFLTNLCCYRKCLPQGAPTSPCLSNIRMIAFDNELFCFARNHNMRFTRYADDITLSGNFAVAKAIRFVDNLLFTEGFMLNASKTRVARQNAQQVVTGIVVNDHMQIPREDRQRIRQAVYYIKKYGLESHLKHIGETRSNYLQHLIGLVGYGSFINPNDSELKESLVFLKSLL